MKRFIWDAMLVFLLVAVGSYVQNKEAVSMDITQKVQKFEEDVATQKNTSKQAYTGEIQKENRASRMAKTTSNLVVDTVKETAGLFAIVFDGVQK